MKEKYIDEEFGLFYDNAGSIFYRFNTRDEKEVDVSSLKEKDIKIIISEHEKLLDKFKKLLNDNDKN